MDNRNENREYQNFLIELIQLINRDNFASREPRPNPYFAQGRRNTNPFQQPQYSNNRYQSAESTYRQQIVDIITQYNSNIHEHQIMMREYNEVIVYALEMLQGMRPNRNVNSNTQGYPTHTAYTSNPSATARVRETNIRNYSSMSSGFRGIFNTPTNIPFTTLFSEPVVVRPTNAQITNATRTFNYSADLSNNIRCPITLEEFQEHDVVCEIKQCRHLFKQESIMDWFQRNVRCPVCRYDIRDYRGVEHEVEHEAEIGVERQEVNEPPDLEENDQAQYEAMETEEEEEERNNPLFPDAGPFYADLSNNISRTSSPLRRQGSPNLNTAIMNSVNNQINTIANNISNILHNYMEQENTQPNDSSSNVFTFEIPIIYFDMSNART
jgi:hypothetical protein